MVLEKCKPKAIIFVKEDLVLFELNILATELSLTHFYPDLEIIVASEPVIMTIEQLFFIRFNDCKIEAFVHELRTLITMETNYNQIKKHFYREKNDSRQETWSVKDPCPSTIFGS